MIHLKKAYQKLKCPPIGYVAGKTTFLSETLRCQQIRQKKNNPKKSMFYTRRNKIQMKKIKRRKNNDSLADDSDEAIMKLDILNGQNDGSTKKTENLNQKILQIYECVLVNM